ncbi:MAG: hypothetical protein AAF826_08670 [Pseudomonadota bacterium]
MDRMVRMVINMLLRQGVPKLIEFFAERRKRDAPPEEQQQIDATTKSQKQNARRANQALRMMRRFTRF